MGEKLYRIRRAQRQLRASLRREASLAELSAATQLSQETVGAALQQQAQPISLELRLGSDGDTALVDLLEDPHPTPEQLLAGDHLHEAIDTLLQALNAREAAVIRQRFGLDDDTPRSLSEIGERLHLSRERVRQIETRALLKLRQPNQRCNLRDHLNTLV